VRTPEQYARAKVILLDAMERPAAERELYVRERIGDDDSLLNDVLSLLVHAVDMTDLDPERATSGDDGEMTTTPIEPTAINVPSVMPERIGRYHVKQMLEEGGMGRTYVATQEQPRRTVVLKVMKAAIASKSALRRFEYESQVLARLRHPNIVQVYEAGTHEEGAHQVPYFVMEYVPNAKPLTDYAKECGLGTRDRLQLFAAVCEAVHHGHQKGIIHRDLKPSNVLVDSEGSPKIIDFGVARSTDSDMAITTLQTDVGQLIGTIQYMSPEQCAADPHDLDTRSDVYALGVMLYELVAGRLPYDVSGVAVHEATRRIVESTPQRPSTVDKTLRGDVETIVLKALEKDRRRRYQSAAGLAADIRRYLSDEPVLARSPSMSYQLSAFARRNKVLVGSAAAIFVVLLAGIAATASQARRATAHAAAEAELREEAQRETQKARQVQAFLQQMLASLELGELPGYDPTFLRIVFDDAARRLETDLADQPAVAAEIRTTIGRAYLRLSLFEEGAAHLERALAYNREHGRDVALAEGLAAMSDYRSHQARPREAEALQREALTIFERELGPDDPRTIETRLYLGFKLGELGRPQEAEACMREALRAAERGLDQGHPLVAKTTFGLAFILDHQGRHDEAEPLQRRAVELIRKADGPDHPRYFWALTLLGWTVLDLERYEEAEDIFRRSIEFYKDDEMTATGNPARGLARTLVEQGRFDDAEELYVWILEVVHRRRPEGHREIASVEREWGRCLTGLGRYEEAEEVLLRSCDWWVRNRGAQDRFTHRVMVRVVELYEAWNKPEKVAEWRRRLEAAGGGAP
jgi:tetratricopeptide (TPR) repeat protein/tRNA A-37 threonylcarbamoyl transferase component Bud32